MNNAIMITEVMTTFHKGKNKMIPGYLTQAIIFQIKRKYKFCCKFEV